MYLLYSQQHVCVRPADEQNLQMGNSYINLCIGLWLSNCFLHAPLQKLKKKKMFIAHTQYFFSIFNTGGSNQQKRINTEKLKPENVHNIRAETEE